jgi:hypothetical protein
MASGSPEKEGRIMETSQPKSGSTTQNAIKLVGEAVMPGASLLMDGKILQGGAHLLVGAAAKVFLGPIGVAFVIANSYAKSTTGKNLLKQFTKDESPRAESPKAEPVPVPVPVAVPVPATVAK